MNLLTCIAAIALMLSAAGILTGADSDSGGAPPKPVPPQWNMQSSALLIAEGSTSPDGRFAIAYPKASEDDPALGRNLLVALKPFRVLALLDGDGLSAGSKRLSLQTEWTDDSSELIATTRHDKWDMIVGSTLAVLKDGQVAKRVDLLEAINREMEPDFRKTKAEVYNDVLPFILTDSKLGFEAGGKLIRIKTSAGNDPNEARAIAWTASFSGVWNVAEGRWQSRKITSKTKKNI